MSTKWDWTVKHMPRKFIREVLAGKWMFAWQWSRMLYLTWKRGIQPSLHLGTDIFESTEQVTGQLRQRMGRERCGHYGAWYHLRFFAQTPQSWSWVRANGCISAVHVTGTCARGQYLWYWNRGCSRPIAQASSHFAQTEQAAPLSARLQLRCITLELSCEWKSRHKSKTDGLVQCESHLIEQIDRYKQSKPVV